MSGTNNKAITIVSGLPRSGTSMMMRMIDAGGIPALTDEIREADEDNPLGYYEYEAVKRTKEDASWLNGASGKVVKMVHLLLYDLPKDRDYRVVFMRRELDELIRSQNAMLVRQGKPTDNLEEVRLKEIFELQLAEAEAFLQKHGCFDSLVISYNDVMKDVPNAAQQVNQFLGGSLDEQAMIDTVDPKLYRQRRKS